MLAGEAVRLLTLKNLVEAAGEERWMRELLAANRRGD